MIEENYNALLAWLSTMESQQFTSYRDLWNGEVFHNLMKKIDQISITQFKQYKEEQTWTSVLANLKKLYKDLENFYRFKIGKSSFDNNYSNLLLIAQNKDLQQIYRFTVQLFGAAVLSNNKNTFISAIIGLKQEHQTALMNLMQSSKFIEGEESVIKEQDQSSYQKKMLLSKVQSLESENQKLQKQVQQILSSKKEQQQRYKRLQQQYRKLKQEYQNKLFQLDNLPQSEIKVNTRLIDEVNTNMIQQLNAKLRQTIENASKQKEEQLDTIDFLKQKIQKYEQDRESRDRTGPIVAINNMTLPEHPPCISMAKHQEHILKQAVKMKQCMKREMELNMENANLKKQVDGMRREIDRMKNDFIRKSDAINKQDYDTVKLNVLQLLRDKFKQQVNKLQAK